MKSQHPISFIGMCTNAAEMHDALHSGLLNCLLVTVGYLINCSHIIQIWVMETCGAKRFHEIDNVCSCKSFCEKVRVLHGTDGSLCAQGFNVFLSFGFAADNRNGISFFN